MVAGCGLQPWGVVGLERGLVARAVPSFVGAARCAGWPSCGRGWRSRLLGARLLRVVVARARCLRFGCVRSYFLRKEEFLARGRFVVHHGCSCAKMVGWLANWGESAQIVKTSHSLRKVTSEYVCLTLLQDVASISESHRKFLLRNPIAVIGASIYYKDRSECSENSLRIVG